MSLIHKEPYITPEMITAWNSTFKVRNFSLSSAGLTTATAQSDFFVAGKWYAIIDAMTDGTCKLSIEQCTTSGQMSISAISGKQLSRYEHIAIQMSS